MAWPGAPRTVDKHEVHGGRPLRAYTTVSRGNRELDSDHCGARTSPHCARAPRANSRGSSSRARGARPFLLRRGRGASVAWRGEEGRDGGGAVLVQGHAPEGHGGRGDRLGPVPRNVRDRMVGARRLCGCQRSGDSCAPGRNGPCRPHIPQAVQRERRKIAQRGRADERPLAPTPPPPARPLRRLRQSRPRCAPCGMLGPSPVPRPGAGLGAGVRPLPPQALLPRLREAVSLPPAAGPCAIAGAGLAQRRSSRRPAVPAAVRCEGAIRPPAPALSPPWRPPLRTRPPRTLRPAARDRRPSGRSSGSCPQPAPADPQSRPCPR